MTNNLRRIVKVPKREFIRRGINQHRLEKSCKQQVVRAVKLAECLGILGEFESEEATQGTRLTRMRDCDQTVY